MTTDYIPADPVLFNGWLNKLIENLDKYQDLFEISAHELQTLFESSETLDRLLSRTNAMREELQAARDAYIEAEKRLREVDGAYNQALSDIQKQTTEQRDNTRVLAERLRNHGNMSPNISAQLGIFGESTAQVEVFVPKNVKVTSNVERTGLVGKSYLNKLTWNEGQNGSGTTYEIEGAPGKVFRGSFVSPKPDQYKIVGTAEDSCEFTHATDKAAYSYRIRARRAGAFSGYSEEVRS